MTVEETEGASIVGIDLGTTYSCLAFIDETGNPQVAKNKIGEATTPSVVYFEEGMPHNESVVGQIAKEASVVYPDRTVQLFKPRMGKKGAVVKTVDGVDITPTEASGHVLRKMALDYKERYGRDVKACVITVPAHFGHLEREATIRAGQAAGLNVVGLVQEPVAAAVFYGVCESKSDSDVLVYDLGGGTFDVTAISIRHTDVGHEIDVAWAEGDHDLGGRLWDNEIVGYLQDEYKKKTKFDGEFTAFSLQQLRTAAEEAKKRLSEVDSTIVTLVLDKGPAQVVLTRELFDDMTAETLLSNTIKMTKTAMDKAAKEGCVAQKILLVGGSTKMPQVREALERSFPDLSVEMTDPAEAVAKGAALCAAIQLFEKIPSLGPGLGPGDTTFNFIASKSYGLKAEIDKEDKISNLICKNQKFGMGQKRLVVEKQYSTTVDFQSSCELKVYESDIAAESVSLEKGELIASGDLDIHEFELKAGSPIDVTFTLDEDGLLHIYAVEPSSGRDVEFERKVTGLQSVEELQESVIGDGSLALVH